MSDERSIGADQLPCDPDSAAVMLAAPLSQLSLTLSTTGWNASMWALTPQAYPLHHPAHDQIVVPEPVEADGEKVLFAR